MPVARPQAPYPEQSLTGWGDPAQRPELPNAVIKLLHDGLGVKNARSPAEIQLPEPPLPAAIVAELAGVSEVHSDRETRLRHLRGKSTPDLLRMRAGDARGAPDLVAFPASHQETLAVLAICSQHRVAVVPFGGGSSVVGGLEPIADDFVGVLALDTRRMNALVALDTESRTATLEPGLRGPEAEALLLEHSFTIGHFPQSFEYATLGGFAAARSSGQASAGYGRFDELVMALKLASPAGTLTVGRAPRTATGPDLRQLILGSEGAFGVITELTLQVRPAPDERVYDGWRIQSFTEGTGVLRGLAQDGPLPTVLRLSDEAETAIGLARPEQLGAGDQGCLAIVGYEGTATWVAERRAAVQAVLAAAGAQPAPGAGEDWERGRYRGPYLRDALLDAGALVETLETAAFWSALPALYERVSAALRDALSEQGTPPVVLCHVSHVYAAGASLYFTVACAQTDDPVAQWRAAKAAAGEAILAAGGSITHHHGVGRDHRPFYEHEVGQLGIDVLGAVKSTLDPAGILNPGILLPDA